MPYFSVFFPGAEADQQAAVDLQTPADDQALTKRECMSLALEALRTKSMSLSKAAEVYNIPATTLWQKANR